LGLPHEKPNRLRLTSTAKTCSHLGISLFVRRQNFPLEKFTTGTPGGESYRNPSLPLVAEVEDFRAS